MYQFSFLSFSVVLMSFSFFMFMFCIYLGSKSMSYSFDWLVFKSDWVNYNFSMQFDWMSCLFVSVVSLISSMILVYSIYYMFDEYNYNRFLYILLIFLVSMIFLVFSNNYISLLLGWDGLGLSSYLLVIFYMNESSSNAGMLTVLSNRLGDVAILVMLSQMLMLGDWSMMKGYSSTMNHICSVSLILASMTKSAQIPFSAWLPAAMAAPTPVSSLVHSSTLVTAGAYLLIRSNSLIVNEQYNKMLFFIGVLTMIMSGVGANSEVDLKKVVALSTLSQLGIMFMMLGGYSSDLCFFHLITHALFKSSLFMCVGFLIHSSCSSQDGRSISMFFKASPFVGSVLVVTNLALTGFPFLAGFYSKDIILEMLYNSNNNLFMLLFILIGTGLTVSYSVRLMYLSMGLSSFSKPLILDCNWANFLISSILGLTMLSISGGYLVSWMVEWDNYMISLTYMGKYYTIFICLMLGLIIYSFMNMKVISYSWMNKGSYKSLSSMWYLLYLSNFMSFNLLMNGFQNIKTLDLGWQEYLGGKGSVKTFLKLSYMFQISQMMLSSLTYLGLGLMIYMML